MWNMNYISDEVCRLAEKHGTRDPFELCRLMGITVRCKDLGTAMKGYYIYISRIKNIVINSRVPQKLARILCAHELGHAVLHNEIAMMKGFQEFELFNSASKSEYEANVFAAELLIEDSEVLSLLNDEEKSFFGVASELYVPAELLDFKFRVLKNKGYQLESPLLSNSDFMKNDMGFSSYNEKN